MKVIVILLVVGLLLGTCCIAADTPEEEPLSADLPEEPGTNGDPAPCGGGSGNGGGAPG